MNGYLRLDLVGRDHREVDALRARHRGDMGVFVHPVAGMGEADRAGDVIVDGIADLRAELGVEPGRMALELDDVPAGREIRAIAGGVPGRARSQFVALDQQRVGPAALGQMIERAGADRAAADDDDAGMGLHRSLYSSAGNPGARKSVRSASSSSLTTCVDQAPPP